MPCRRESIGGRLPRSTLANLPTPSPLLPTFECSYAGASERGGFGAAKNLIFFAQKFYIVESAHAETGDWFQMRGSKNKHDKKVRCLLLSPAPLRLPVMAAMSVRANACEEDPVVALTFPSFISGR